MGEPGFGEWVERTLGGLRLFAGVGVETVIRVGEAARWRRLPAGTTLLRTGDVRTSFFALVQGAAREHSVARRSGVTVEAPASLGLRVAFRKAPSADIIVTTTPALVAEIHRIDLLDAMAVSPALALNVGELLADRSTPADPRRLLDHQILEALGQAVAGLATQTGVVRLPAPIQPAVWATLLGVGESDVVRALLRLARHGIVRRGPEGVGAVDLDRLRERLE